MPEVDPTTDSESYCHRCGKVTFSRYEYNPGRAAWRCIECNRMTDELFFDEADDPLFKPLTIEEANRALENVTPIPMSAEEIEGFVRLALDGPRPPPAMPPRTIFNTANFDE